MSYIAFLRGINLGKKNKVDMKSLKALFEEMGFQNVQTYIQTGNVIFDNIVCDESQMELKLKDTYGFNIPVTIRSKAELEKVQQHPILSKENVFIMFLKKKISKEQMEHLKAIIDEEFDVIEEKTIIINLTNQTKYNNTFFEKQLKMPSTLRKSTTVHHILLRM